MLTLFLSFLSGLIVGLLFGLLKLPIPAPPTISGILGIFGIYVGSLVANYFRNKFNF